MTLLELLVVLILIGVIATAVTLSVGLAGPAGTLPAEEAQRLARLIQLQCQEAILQTQELGVQIQPPAYLFLRWTGEEWEPRADRAFQPYRLDDALEMELSIDGRPADTAEVDALPQVVCYSSGEMTTFELSIGVAQQPDRYLLRGAADGELTLAGWQS